MSSTGSPLLVWEVQLFWLPSMRSQYHSHDRSVGAEVFAIAVNWKRGLELEKVVEMIDELHAITFMLLRTLIMAELSNPSRVLVQTRIEFMAPLKPQFHPVAHNSTVPRSC